MEIVIHDEVLMQRARKLVREQIADLRAQGFDVEIEQDGDVLAVVNVDGFQVLIDPCGIAREARRELLSSASTARVLGAVGDWS